MQKWLFNSRSGAAAKWIYLKAMKPEGQVLFMAAMALVFMIVGAIDSLAQGGSGDLPNVAQARIEYKVDGFGSWLISKIQFWGVVIGVVAGVIKFFGGSERDSIQRGMKSFGMAAGLSMLGYIIAWIFSLGEGGTFARSSMPSVFR